MSDVEISVNNPEGEHFSYKIKFANDAAKALAFEFEAAEGTKALFVNQYTNAQVGVTYLADLAAAQITQVTSTTISVDAGSPPVSGGGIEVRWSDAGWGPGNDRNLVVGSQRKRLRFRDCLRYRTAICNNTTIPYHPNFRDTVPLCTWIIPSKRNPTTPVHTRTPPENRYWHCRS